MSQPTDNTLLLEILKKIQGDVSHTRERVEDLGQQLISVREQIHHLQGEVLRVDKDVTQRLLRIERRLELADA